MADKKCPECGLWNTEAAVRCDCGYDFASGEMIDSQAKGKKVPLIISIFIGGIAGLAGAFARMVIFPYWDFGFFCFMRVCQ